MNKKLRILILSPLLVFIFSGAALAQKKNEIFKNRYTDQVKIDGDLSDWNDSLQAYNSSTRLSYAAANDDQNLYIAVKTSDPVEVSKIAAFGFSFSVNIQDKKKPGTTLTFPLIDRTAMQHNRPQKGKPSTKPDFSKINQEIISKANGIKIEGFKEIPDGAISINNDYGIKAAATLDSSNVFRCELAVPLNLLNLSSGFKDPLYYNFKVNGLTRTVLQQGMPRYGYGGYGYGYGYGYPYDYNDTYRRTISDAVDFWVRYTLANH